MLQSSLRFVEAPSTRAAQSPKMRPRFSA